MAYCIIFGIFVGHWEMKALLTPETSMRKIYLAGIDADDFLGTQYRY